MKQKIHNTWGRVMFPKWEEKNSAFCRVLNDFHAFLMGEKKSKKMSTYRPLTIFRSFRKKDLFCPNKNNQKFCLNKNNQKTSTLLRLLFQGTGGDHNQTIFLEGSRTQHGFTIKIISRSISPPHGSQSLYSPLTPETD